MVARLVWWMEKTEDGYVEAIPANYLEAVEDGDDDRPATD